MADPNKSDLFSSLCFYIIEGSLQQEKEIKSILKRGGAIEELFISSLVTHVITDETVTEPKAILGDDCQACIVNSDWVVLCSKFDTIIPIEPFEMTGGKLLTDIVICPTQLSADDREKAWLTVSYYGGRYQGILNSNVTHLLALHPRGRKYQAAIEYGIKVVTPLWLIDTIEHNQIQPEDNYSLDFISSLMESNSNFTSDHFNVTSLKVTIPLDVTRFVRKRSYSSSEVISPVIQMMHDGDDRINASTISSSFGDSQDTQISPTPQPIPKAKEDVINKRSEVHLLDGMTFFITDYLQLMGGATIKKWKELIVSHGGRVIDEYSFDLCTHVIAQNKTTPAFAQAYKDSKCISSAHWLNDVLSRQVMFPPSNPLHYPVAYSQPPSWIKQLSMTLSNYTGGEREIVHDMICIADIPFTPFMNQSTTHVICKRDEGRKFEKACQWNIKVVNSLFVADIIHNGHLPNYSSSKYNTFGAENEFNASCYEAIRLLKPWKDFLIEYSSHNKHLIDEKKCNECFKESFSSDIHEPSPPKIIKTDPVISTGSTSGCNESSESFVVMFTGLDTDKCKLYKKYCLSLGGSVTGNPKLCTHLISEKIVRTVKFLCGISVCRYILAPLWIEKSFANGRFVEEEPFLLHDVHGEDTYQMKLETSLCRACQAKLLDGIVFFATPNVSPMYDDLKMIIECAGGTLLKDRELKSRYGRRLELLDSSGVKLIILTCQLDVESCRELLRNHQEHQYIYNAEFVLTGILRQALDYNSNKISL